MDKLTREAANILYGLLRAFAHDKPEEIGDGVQDVPLVLSAVRDGLSWLNKYELTQQDELSETVGQMEIDVVQTPRGLEFQYQGITLAKIQPNQPAINQIQVVQLDG